MPLETLPNVSRWLRSTSFVLLNHQDCLWPEDPQTSASCGRTCSENLEGTGRSHLHVNTTSHYKTLQLLGIFSVMTVAGPMCCHKAPASSISLWPCLPRTWFYATHVPRRMIIVNVIKWSIVRSWTSYASNSASILTFKWNSWMEFGEILLGNVTIFSRNLSCYSDSNTEFRCFKKSYLICSLEDFTFVINLLMALKHS